MATSGRGSGVVDYNVQTAVDTENHLIVAHDVTMSGSDRAQLARMSKLTKATDLEQQEARPFCQSRLPLCRGRRRLHLSGW